MLTHRPLESGDLETICSFPQNRQELFYIGPRFVFPLTPKQIEDLLATRFSPTVVVDSESDLPVAYANLYDKDEGAKTIWLGNVIVSPPSRGTGVAGSLVRRMQEQAINAHDAKSLKLYCHNTNTRALLFYSRLGFTPCGAKEIVNYDQAKIVAIEMELDLRKTEE